MKGKYIEFIDEINRYLVNYININGFMFDENGTENIIFNESCKDYLSFDRKCMIIFKFKQIASIVSLLYGYDAHYYVNNGRKMLKNNEFMFRNLLFELIYDYTHYSNKFNWDFNKNEDLKLHKELMDKIFKFVGENDRKAYTKYKNRFKSVFKWFVIKSFFRTLFIKIYLFFALTLSFFFNRRFNVKQKVLETYFKEETMKKIEENDTELLNFIKMIKNLLNDKCCISTITSLFIYRYDKDIKDNFKKDFIDVCYNSIKKLNETDNIITKKLNYLLLNKKFN